MAAPTEAQIAHQQLIEQLDIHSIHKNFRNPNWRPNQRRNKNLKAIVGDASRREASALATPQDMSGDATPADDGLSTSGTTTPANSSSGSNPPNLAQASRSLSKLVLEKSLKPSNGAGAAVSAPTATYTNIESAPSLSHSKHYCDITGLPAPYLDPKTRLRYHNGEVFGLIRSIPQTTAEQFLEARGAHTILK